MWNPALDVISLAKIDKSQNTDEQCLSVFLALFSHQVGEIQRLVVETDYWPQGRAGRGCPEWLAEKIIEFSDLIEFAVLVDPYTKRAFVESYETNGNLVSCENKSKYVLEAVADRVRRSLVTVKERQMKNMKGNKEDYSKLIAWFPSRIRVVEKEEEVLGQE
jgi:hypothetical protein